MPTPPPVVSEIPVVPPVIPKKSKLKKIIVWIIGLIVVAGALFFIFPQPFIVAYIRTKVPESKFPIVYQSPEFHELNPIVFSNPITISHFGVIIEVPWQTLTEENKKEAIIQARFDDGNKKITFMKNGLTRSLRSYLQEAGTIDSITKLLGENVSASDFALEKKLQSVDASELKVFSPRDRIFKDAALIAFKAVYSVPVVARGIYEFRTPTYQGFQFGIPEGGDTVWLEFFDQEGKLVNNLVVIGATQPEIDYIIENIRISS